MFGAHQGSSGSVHTKVHCNLIKPAQCEHSLSQSASEFGLKQLFGALQGHGGSIHLLDIKMNRTNKATA